MYFHSLFILLHIPIIRYVIWDEQGYCNTPSCGHRRIFTHEHLLFHIAHPCPPRRLIWRLDGRCRRPLFNLFYLYDLLPTNWRPPDLLKYYFGDFGRFRKVILMFLVFVNQLRAGSVSVAASGVTIGACFYIFKLKSGPERSGEAKTHVWKYF